MRRILTATIATLVLAGASQARADMIMFTESIVGTGTFNGSSFTNALVTFTEVADTANIQSLGQGYQLAGTATVTVAGLGSDGLPTTEIETQPVSQYFPALISFDSSDDKGTNIIYDFSNDLNGYDLSTSIGPIVGTGAANLYSPISTTTGSFDFTSVTGSSTFTATLTSSAVPEPSSLAMCGLAGLIGSAYAWRRRKRAAIA
jgi:hypothetical protein